MNAVPVQAPVADVPAAASKSPKKSDITPKTLRNTMNRMNKNVVDILNVLAALKQDPNSSHYKTELEKIYKFASNINNEVARVSLACDSKIMKKTATAEAGKTVIKTGFQALVFIDDAIARIAEAYMKIVTSSEFLHSHIVAQLEDNRVVRYSKADRDSLKKLTEEKDYLAKQGKEMSVDEYNEKNAARIQHLKDTVHAFFTLDLNQWRAGCLVSRQDVVTLIWEYCRVTGLRSLDPNASNAKYDAFLYSTLNIDGVAEWAEKNGKSLDKNVLQYKSIQLIVSHHVKNSDILIHSSVNKFPVLVQKTVTAAAVPATPTSPAIPEQYTCKVTFTGTRATSPDPKVRKTGLPYDFDPLPLMEEIAKAKKEGVCFNASQYIECAVKGIPYSADGAIEEDFEDDEEEFAAPIPVKPTYTRRA